MKKNINMKVMAGIVGLFVLLGVSFGVYAATNSSDDKTVTEQTTNRTQNEIKVKSNVSKTPIVQPKDDSSK
ncbi:hypothetical protein MX629_00105 [Carnobacterium divergens]|uniref:Secreted protein n=1 Tax=Carnobacterium divergens TaxID=2748 RepID=A0AAW8R919_CARDV|nr:hypothetical protein [Carnobacterium divergens]MDT1956821.1 hypothetical protein [Carnobacterium divergens]MDT1972791.1 hypothetical protein [Carnobacterium divergens]